MISRDAGILQEGSDVQKRMAEYGALAEELHIVVFNQASNVKSQTLKVGGNAWAYPTNSRNKWFYIHDAYVVAKQIIATRYSLLATRWLVTTQDPFETGIVGWLVARKHHLPLQLQIHTDLFSPYFARESALNKIRVRIAQFLIPRASGIRVVSDRIKKSLVSRFKFHDSRITVLPIFVDVQKIKDTPIKIDLRKKYPQFDFIALMASRFTREKNIPMKISAMAEVVKKHPKAGLVIVGNGPEEQKLKLLATRYSLLSHVVFEPWTDDLASYYKTADVFVLTSNYEGYGRTPIEAEAAGCPVIMTDVGIAGEIIKHGENGLVVPIGDTQALADAVMSVIDEKVIVRAVPPEQQTKEAYLAKCRVSWESALNS
ncbi:glycosyltransferase [Candidatus Azambacteria bacterium]|nr:glycosyltransferase [Candidatus Azambacteria bacterium]